MHHPTDRIGSIPVSSPLVCCWEFSRCNHMFDVNIININTLGVLGDFSKNKKTNKINKNTHTHTKKTKKQKQISFGLRGCETSCKKWLFPTLVPVYKNWITWC